MQSLGRPAGAGTRCSEHALGQLAAPARLARPVRQFDAPVHRSLAHPPAVATATPSGSNTQPVASTSGAAASNWSKRLLEVAKKKGKGPKDEAAAQVDVFHPAPKPASPIPSPRQPQLPKLPPVGNDPNGQLVFDGDMYDDEDEEGLEDGPQRKRIPAEMRCFDTARIYIKGGDGGNGCVAFRREKFVEFGGPSGGTGGRGGHVWAVVDPDLNSLSCFRRQIHFRANNGVNGTGSNCDGADAEDLFVSVPPGTIIRRKDADEDEPPLAELLKPGEKALLATGGRGGRGNFSFKTSRDRAPTIAEKGQIGQELWTDLELKVVADAGIIGVPNAGKSTLLSVITAAKPKIANYPFTTLVPNLGVCETDYRTTVFADVPGLLEGAHEGLGLGHEFLRHVQRCRVLVHVIDGTSPDPVGDFSAINLELELFNPELKDKPQIVAYNKVDLPDSGDFWEMVREQLVDDFGVAPERIFPISAGTGQGVVELVRAVRAVLDEMGPQVVQYETNAVNQTKVVQRGARVDDFTVTVEALVEGSATRVYVVEGEGIEKFAQMTNWNYYEAVRRFQRVLEVSGISGALRAKGVKQGDSVVIGDTEFAWSDDRSEGAVYDAWLRDIADRGIVRQGSARWPQAKNPRNK